jgi:membrane peptidoglycan carboxypeptidase
LRRPTRLILPALALLVLVGFGALWIFTPPATDLQQRVAKIAAAERVPVLAPEQVPPLLAQALVAIEDERFYEHHGLDSIGIARATLDDIRYACFCEGGSTLTEQVADMAYYAGSGRGRRKLPSMTVGLKIELHERKQRILADYLTIVPMGAGLTGAQRASCTYFHHRLDQINLAEAAELAGMPQAPSAYDPRYHPQAARSRRSEVLRRMQEMDYISSSQRAGANAQPVVESGSQC